MNTVKRTQLIKALSLVRPALAVQQVLPALSHLYFQPGSVSAYNDVTMLQVPMPGQLHGLLPGELLLKALGSLTTEQVELASLGEGSGQVLLSAGRSRIKLPCLPPADYLFSDPQGPCTKFTVTDPFISALTKCLITVGSDHTHPAQMGVTVQVEDGVFVLYSTDNATISRADTGQAAPTGLDQNFVCLLPTFFCQQLTALATMFEEDDIVLSIRSTSVSVHIGKSRAVTKVAVDVEPLDFARIVSKYVDRSKVAQQLSILPDDFDQAIQRAVLVQSDQPYKTTKITCSRDGAVSLHSSGTLATADDDLSVIKPNKMPDSKFAIDPVLVARMSKHCGSFSFQPKVMVMATDDAKFLHIVAQVTSAE